MGYTNCVIREFETGEATFRRIDTGEYVIVICFEGWRKSHIVHPAYGPENQPKLYAGIGQCFEASKRHYPNCIIGKTVSKPLATSDMYYPEDGEPVRWVDRINDVPVC